MKSRFYSVRECVVCEKPTIFKLDFNIHHSACEICGGRFASRKYITKVTLGEAEVFLRNGFVRRVV